MRNQRSHSHTHKAVSNAGSLVLGEQDDGIAAGGRLGLGCARACSAERQPSSSRDNGEARPDFAEPTETSSTTYGCYAREPRPAPRHSPLAVQDGNGRLQVAVLQHSQRRPSTVCCSEAVRRRPLRYSGKQQSIALKAARSGSSCRALRARKRAPEGLELHLGQLDKRLKAALHVAQNAN